MDRSVCLIFLLYFVAETNDPGPERVHLQEFQCLFFFNVIEHRDAVTQQYRIDEKPAFIDQVVCKEAMGRSRAAK